MVKYCWIFPALAYFALTNFQGIDYTDFGKWLTGFMWFFEAPESLSWYFVNWLVYLNGYYIYTLFELFAPLALRIQYFLIFLLSLVFVFWYLRQASQENCRFAVLCFPLIFVSFYTDRHSDWPEMNTLSLVCILCAAGLLRLSFIFGEARNRKKLGWMAWALGIVLGLSVFVRLPNLAWFPTFVALIWFFNRGPKVVSQTSIFLVSAGFLCGLFVVLILLFSFDHLDVYMGHMQGLFADANEGDSNHSLSELFWVYARHLAYAIAIGFGSICIIKVGFRTKLAEHLPLFVILGLAILAGFSMQFMRLGDFWIPGILIVWSMHCVLRARREGLIFSREINALTIAFFCMFLLPVGSNNGILNAFIASGPLLGLFTLACLKPGYFRLLKPDFLGKRAVRFVLTTGLTFAAVSHFDFVYRDGPSRTELTTLSKSFPGLFTSSAREHSFTVLQAITSNRLDGCEELIVLGDAPLVHYLTGTRPALEHPWPFLMTTRHFEAALKIGLENKLAPVMIPRFSTVEGYFPNSLPPSDSGWEQDAKREIFEDAVARAGYIEQFDFIDVALLNNMREDGKNPFRLFVHPSGCGVST